MPSSHPEDPDRKSWMSLLARAPADRLAALFPDPLPDHSLLRAPEIGSVMVQGRIGGTGAPFNLGEMTVTRCSLRLAAAAIDALMQTGAAPALRPTLDTLATEEATRRTTRAAKAAATKVDFFTMVRGEDK